MRMNTKYAVLTLFAIATVFGAGYMLQPDTGVQANTVTEKGEWHGVATAQVIRDGEVVHTMRTSNLITTQGLDWMASQISAVDNRGADTQEAEHLALGNGTAPVAGSTVLDSEHIDAETNLGRTTGTTVKNSNANFTVYNVFTANATTEVNTTSLNWDVTEESATIIAGAAYPRTVPIQPGDKINQSWTVYLQDGS